LFKTYLERLETIEGVSRKEFVKKVLNADNEFEAKPGDNDQEKNRLDTLKLIYSADRFFMSKLYKEDSLDVLINGDKLTAFINEVLNGERALYWESTKAKFPKYS
jgi:hypothetical protein